MKILLIVQKDFTQIVTQNDKDVKILAVGNINYSNNNYNSISKRNNINNLPWTKIELEDIKKTFKNTYSLGK